MVGTTSGLVSSEETKKKKKTKKSKYCVVRGNSGRKSFTYWHDTSESAYAEAERLANEVGGFFLVLKSIGGKFGEPKNKLPECDAGYTSCGEPKDSGCGTSEEEETV